MGGPIDAETLEEEASCMSVPLATTQPDPNNPTTTSVHNQPHVSALKEVHQHNGTEQTLSNGILDSSNELVISSGDNRETVIASTIANS